MTIERPSYSYVSQPSHIVSDPLEPIDETKIGEHVEKYIINPAIAENETISILANRVFIEGTNPQKDEDDSIAYKIYIRVDLSQMPTLTKKTELLANNDLVSTYLNELYYDLNTRGKATDPKVEFTITHVQIQKNHISGRSLLQSQGDFIKSKKKKTIAHRAFTSIDPSIASLTPSELNRALYDDTKQDIQYADYSHTSISYTGLKFMFRLPNLVTLKMDYCPKATYIEDVSEFPCKTVRIISLLGAALCNVESLLKDLEQKFPNIERIDFTQQPFDGKDHKFIGFLDIADQTSTISPHAVIPCGHIHSRINAGRQFNKECWTCRRKVEGIVEASIFQTRLEKIEGTWKVDILDFLRYPITSPTLYHPECRQAFNATTIAQIFKISIESDSLNDIAAVVAEKDCPGCQLQGRVSSMKLMPIFPILTEKSDVMADSQQQETLESACEYINIGKD